MNSINFAISDNIRSILSQIIVRLKHNDIPYTIIGGVARKHYAPAADITDDIDFLFYDADRDDVLTILRTNKLEYSKEDRSQYKIVADDPVRIDLLFAPGEIYPEQLALSTVEKANLDGMEVKIASIYALMWMLLQMPTPDENKINVLKNSESFKLNNFKYLVLRHGDTDDMKLIAKYLE